MTQKTDMNEEEAWFTEIAPRIIALVQSSLDDNFVHTQKSHDNDYATKIDVDVENLIVDDITQRFPGDKILAEEGHSEESIGHDRVWIIDPICGTSNLGRGIHNYCSNIALAVNGEVVAACVVDLDLYEYYWSVGGGKLYQGKQLIKPEKRVPGVVVDVDFGAVESAARSERVRHQKLIAQLQVTAGYRMSSLNTSLSNLYVALQKLDAVVVMATKPWDVAASAFLVAQAGGFVTRLDGSSWHVAQTDGYILAGSEDVHKTLLRLLNKSD